MLLEGFAAMHLTQVCGDQGVCPASLSSRGARVWSWLGGRWGGRAGWCLLDRFLPQQESTEDVVSGTAAKNRPNVPDSATNR